MRNVFRILVGNPNRNIPHRIHRCSWEDNIKMDVTEIRREVVDRTGSGCGTAWGSCPQGNRLSGSIRVWEIADWLSDC
jgi:hypothetical protein